MFAFIGVLWKHYLYFHFCYEIVNFKKNSSQDLFLFKYLLKLSENACAHRRETEREEESIPSPSEGIVVLPSFLLHFSVLLGFGAHVHNIHNWYVFSSAASAGL